MQFNSPSNIRGTGDIRGPLERHLRDLQNAIKELASGAFIDIDSEATGGNTTLGTSFSTALTHSYSPPAGWGTYKVQLEIWASAAGLNSGDQFQIVPQVTGGATGTGTIVTDDAAATSRSTAAYMEVDDIEGDIAVLVRVRNNTAARGTVYVAGSRLVAVRTS